MEFVVYTLLAVIAILVAIVIALYQERSAKIKVECYPLPNGNPCTIECVVNNSGKRAAQDVYVGFTKMLPVGARVFAAPETMIQMIESETPPDPNLAPSAAMLSRAFAIHVPRVAPKDKVVFQVRTIDPDNQRAAKQVTRVREEINKILKAFGERLAETNPKDAKSWNVESLVSARIKRDNFFAPGKYSYEEGRFPVAFLTEEEEQANALNQDLYARYKVQFIDIYQNRPEFKAPVVRIKTEEGERTYAIYPPYLKTYVEVQVPVSQLKEQGVVLVYPPVPESYD